MFFLNGLKARINSAQWQSEAASWVQKQVLFNALKGHIKLGFQPEHSFVFVSHGLPLG